MKNMLYGCLLLSATSFGSSLPTWTPEGLVYHTPDLNNEIRLKFLLQTDQDIFFDTQGLTINNGVTSKPILNQNTVDRIWVRRIRPIITGALLKNYQFVFVPDFGQGQTRLFDGLMDIHFNPWFNFSAGKQLSFVSGIEQLKDQGTLYTMEFGYPSALAPNREIGFALHGAWTPSNAPTRISYVQQRGFDSLFSYQIGVFSGTADDTNPGLNPTSTTSFSTETATLENKSIELRLFSNPFLTSSNLALKGLGIGFSTSYDDPNDQNELPALLSVGQNPIMVYNSDVAADGQRYRFHPQGYWFYKQLGFVMDWAFTSQTLAADTHRVLQHNQAGQAELIYNLTGEENHYLSNLTPKHPFRWHEKKAWGAFQGIARWSQLWIDSNTFTENLYADPRISISRANTFSIGFNWILNPYARILFEYDQTFFKGGCSTGAMMAPYDRGCLTSGNAAFASGSEVRNRPNEILLMQRLQIQF